MKLLAAIILIHSFYDSTCCSDKDCYPLPDDHIKEVAEGYLVPETGEVIPHGDPKIRFSPDGKWHRCSHNGGDRKAITICLYVPGRGS